MKKLKIFFILVLLSLQAGATGYSQNMFVAQKKLSERKAARAGKSTEKVKKQEILGDASGEEGDFYRKEVRAVAGSVSQTLSGWVLKLLSRELP